MTLHSLVTEEMVPEYRHVYVHVPFCARRCSYCDFAIAVRKVVPWREFVEGVRQEIAVRNVAQPHVLADTLYLGGGTPSRLGVEGVTALLSLLREQLPWAETAEVTLEANPEDVTASAVRAWRAAGVNRLSIGVQSFDDAVLEWMHRVHSAQAAREAVGIARNEGLHAFSLDLIFAAPEHLQRDWSRDLHELLALGPDHVSLYGLTIEPQTPLGKWRDRGEITESPEERYEAEFMLAHELLGSAGYEHYEVSNFARAGKRARHNSAYWSGAPYLGLGPSAHGFDGTDRRWNVPALTGWEAALAKGDDPMEDRETLTDANRTAESVYLGLRTRDGLSVFDAEEGRVAPWVAAGWVEWLPANPLEARAPRRIRCTAQGWLRLDAMAADLTAFRSRS